MPPNLTTTLKCLKPIIGLTCIFQIKLKDYNFTGTPQTFLVSRIVSDAGDLENLDPSEADATLAAAEAGGKDECHQILTTTLKCLKPIIGLTCIFQIKLKDYYFTATPQTFLVSRIVSDVADLENLDPSEADATLAAAEVVVASSLSRLHFVLGNVETVVVTAECCEHKNSDSVSFSESQPCAVAVTRAE
ncbi:unnamed protein product [Microthlaspi erraticum]|uniref:Uncharacterized protein n=1 Tax=Microthlaspi erraticum TaxID=1685480 RepID=A0A6D2IKH1_9BRAS|nr:unnamed protein product [Microthlaspi erraticum]